MSPGAPGVAPGPGEPPARMRPGSHARERRPLAAPATPPSSAIGALERLAQGVAQWAGSTSAFVLAAGAVVLWLVTGPFFGYSENWQLVINTGTTIVTFLMVFLIQRSQNKEARAVQLKLSEIVASIAGASNRMIGAEDLSEAELDRLARRFRQLQERDPDRTRAAISIEDELDNTVADLPPARRGR